MAQKAQHLRVVDERDGQLQELHELDDCPKCITYREENDELRKQLTGMEKDIRAWRTRHANAIADREKQAKSNPLWPEAVQLFEYWRERCNHPRAKWGRDRFELVEPLIREYGPMICRRAIDGAAFDPFITKRKNGSRKRHDGWELIFRDSGKLEEFANRAPLSREA